MIDLHIHSKYSIDGILGIDELLSKAEKNNLDYFSVTDHNNVNAYKIDIPKYKNLFSGKIINGVEINSKILQYPVEILCYGYDIDKIEDYLQSYFSDKKKLKLHIDKVKFLFSIADKLGFKYDKKVLDINSVTTYATEVFYEEITKYPENKAKFPSEAWDDQSLFYRKYFMNPDNKLWYFFTKDAWPDSKELIKKIHEFNGLAFLAHPLEYKYKNIKKILDIVVKQKIDGIECYHLSAQGENNKFLLDYAKTHNLLISGGSDFHGTMENRMSIIGDQKMPFTIPTNTITNWVSKL